MQMINIKLRGAAVCIATLTIIAGCDGGATLANYETYSSTAEATSTLGGTAIRSNAGSGAFNITKSTGTLTHNTGATTLDDGTYALTDADGFDDLGVLTDGDATLIVTTADNFIGIYDFVIAYTQEYSSGGVSYDSTGFVGIVTNSSDVPTAGSATYTGEAVVEIAVAAEGYSLTAGTSTLQVNFAAGTADLTMNNFTSVDQAPIDSITAIDMVISGNSFSGSTLQTTSGGSVVDITGANTYSTASGNFFGYDYLNSTPDETAGVIHMQGDSGIIGGAFIAN